VEQPGGKLCKISPRQRRSERRVGHPRRVRPPSRYISPSRWKTIILVCRRGAFSRPRARPPETGGTLGVSHLIIPTCRRAARAALVPEKYDPAPFQRRIVVALLLPLPLSLSLSLSRSLARSLSLFLSSVPLPSPDGRGTVSRR